MSIPPLTIIPAGAGSGKTYTIQKTLADWIVAGHVAPDRIVAVTFTEAAAAEMKGRIRGQLVALGRLEDALKLDQAYISTIHGFGNRILKDFAFDAGISPRLRKLSEDEENILIRLALARTDRADEVTGSLTALGYRYSGHVRKSPEDLFREAVLQMIGKRRSIGSVTDDAAVLTHVKKRIRELYGPTGNAADLKKDLLDAVKALLKKHPSNLSGIFAGVNDTAERDMRKNFDALKRASGGDALDSDWKLWSELRDLRTSGNKGTVPVGYKELAEEVMAAAEGILRHPGPLDDALKHAEALMGASQDAFTQYAKEKREKGLIDFFDMLALAHNIVLRTPSVLATLKDSVDCLIIDEFQDTNPLQFALLWSLRCAGVPALIVGDLKQAIMGFQDADCRLMEEIQCQNRSACKPLTQNWRSTPKLMAWINAVGKGLFPKDYTELEARAAYKSTMAPLEAVVFTKNANMTIRAQHTAARIAELLAEGEKVYDRHLGATRSIRPSDIAILCFKHDRLAVYAEALKALGVRTRMEQDGWLGSRAVQLAYYALSYAADPADRHAALYLAVTELGDSALEDTLTGMFDGRTPESSVLKALAAVADGPLDMSVSDAVGAVMAALDLYGKVAVWPDAAQARANLLRLQGMAEEFEDANREALASGRFYGSGLKTFLAWLTAAAGDDDGQPDPSVVDEQAVQLVTWHASKGREWPVVAVGELESKVEARLQRFDVAYKDFSDIANVLDKAMIEISPAFPLKEKTDSVKASLQPEVEEDAKRLLYVMLTRAREKLILECNVYSAAGTSNYWNLLRRTTGLTVGKKEMTVGGVKFPCIIRAAAGEPPAEFEGAGKAISISLPVIGRRAIKPGKVPSDIVPEAVTPSSMHDGEPVKVTGLVTTKYGKGIELEGDLEPMERGNILHRCFEVLGQREIGIEPLRKATGYAFTEKEYQGVKEAVADLGKHLEKHFSPVSLSREVPILALNKEGSVVSGVVDFVVETAQGLWILDHKTDTSDDLDMKFGDYARQLQAYTEAVQGAMEGKKVLGVGINWVKYGKLMTLAL